MADLVEALKQKFFNANGEPLAGGKLYSYQAGTTTPLVTYANQDESTENTNPIILDANGEADVWIGPNAYKFRLEDADGNLLWTVDNVSHLSPDSISNLMLQDRSVTSVKIAISGVETENLDDAAVTTAKVANGAIAAPKLATDAVETAKIKDANVTLAKMATGSVDASKLTTDAVETAKIKDLNVTTGKIADGAVTGSKILSGTVALTNMAATPWSTSVFSASSTSSTTFTTLASVSFTPTRTASSKPIMITLGPRSVAGTYYFESPSGGYIRFKLKHNGSDLMTWEFGCTSGSMRIPMNLIYWLDTAYGFLGTTSYEFQVSASTGTASWTNGTMFVIQSS